MSVSLSVPRHLLVDKRGSNALIEQRGVHHFCLWCRSDLFLPLTTAMTRVDLRHDAQRCLIHCLFGLWTHRHDRLCCKTVLKHDMRSRTGCASLTRLGSKRTIRSWSWLDLGLGLHRGTISTWQLSETKFMESESEFLQCPTDEDVCFPQQAGRILQKTITIVKNK